MAEAELSRHVDARLAQRLLEQPYDPRDIIRVDQREGVGADQLVGEVAEDPLDRRTFVEDGPIARQDRDDVRRVLHQGAEAHLAPANRLLGLLLLSDVEHDAVPEAGAAGLVRHQHRVVTEPDDLAVAGEQAVLDAERLAGPLGAAVFREHAIAVIGVEETLPEVRSGDPLVRRVAENRFDLGADVDDRPGLVRFVQRLGVGDHRQVLDQRAVLGLRFAQPRLRPPVLGHVLDAVGGVGDLTLQGVDERLHGSARGTGKGPPIPAVRDIA